MCSQVMANASKLKPLLTSQPNDDHDEEAVEVWIIGWTCRNHQMFVNDDRIILLSLCQPTLEFSFIPNRWMQFVASIWIIADIIRLSPYERKAIESRRHGLFRRHLGDGYYIDVMYHYTSLVRFSSTLQCSANWTTDILSDLSHQERY